jgi:hypothetical protein
MTWSAVIVFAALATAAVLVVVSYHRGNRKLAAAASQTDTPLTLLESEVDPDLDEAPTDSWIWR